MLYRKLKNALEYARYHQGCSEEAASHYSEPFTMLDSWSSWWKGFISGWRKTA